MNSARVRTLRGKDGLRGTIESRPDMPAGERAEQVAVRMEDGEQLMVPANLLQQQDDGSYYLPLSRQDLMAGRTAGDPESTVVPIIEEELAVRRQQVLKGGVRVHKQVHEREEVVDEPTFTEQVHVERVAINRMLDGPVSIRQEGDTLIVPVVEEVLVVERRLMLKEELRITKERHERRDPQRITLRREEAILERFDASEHTSTGDNSPSDSAEPSTGSV